MQLSFYQRRFLTLKYAKNPFVALGELTTLPRPPSRLGRGIPLPRPLPSRHLWRLDLAPLALATRRLDFCPPLQKILAAPMVSTMTYFVLGSTT